MNTNNQMMSYLEHLRELRSRLTRVLFLFLICFGVGFFGAEKIVQFFLGADHLSGMTWNVFHVTDGIHIYMQTAFLLSLMITIPYTAYEIWAFIGPGLKPKEKKALAPLIPISGFLFILGILFAYFIILPMLVHFLSEIVLGIGAQESYGVAQYFGFLFNILFPFGLLFEIPLVVWFLTKIGILNPKQLMKMRKIAYLVLLVVAVTITPPDFISDVLVTIPLILLYEVSVLLSFLVYKPSSHEE